MMFETMAAQAVLPSDAILVWHFTQPALGRVGFGLVLFFAGLVVGWAGAKLRPGRGPVPVRGIATAAARAGFGQA